MADKTDHVAAATQVLKDIMVDKKVADSVRANAATALVRTDKEKVRPEATLSKEQIFEIDSVLFECQKGFAPLVEG